MKAEELLEKCEEKINKPWYNWINLRFLWYGFWDKTKKIREKVFEGIEGLDEDEVETFTKICDSRIDRIKTSSRDLVIGISVLAASLGIMVTILFERVILEGGISPGVLWFFTSGWCWLGMKITQAVVFIVIVLLALLIGHYWTQVHAWYAIKEECFIRDAKRKREEKAKDTIERN
ncbi:MAG: hypothetical protein WA977_07420 [Halobacteriota archaeon]